MIPRSFIGVRIVVHVLRCIDWCVFGRPIEYESTTSLGHEERP